MMRSFARARSSSRRAPPNAASKRCSAMASSRVTVCRRLREAPGAGLLAHAAGVDRLLHGGDDEPDAELLDAPVAVLDDLREVVAGVDVHDRKRQARGVEGLLGDAQQDRGVLAAREQQDGALELRGDLAHDEDRLGLQQAEIGQVAAHA